MLSNEIKYKINAVKEMTCNSFGADGIVLPGYNYTKNNLVARLQLQLQLREVLPCKWFA